jgi:hypothetical protein
MRTLRPVRPKRNFEEPVRKQEIWSREWSRRITIFWHQGFEEYSLFFDAPSIVSTEELVPTPTFPGPDKSDEKWPINLNPLVN